MLDMSVPLIGDIENQKKEERRFMMERMGLVENLNEEDLVKILIEKESRLKNNWLSSNYVVAGIFASTQITLSRVISGVEDFECGSLVILLLSSLFANFLCGGIFISHIYCYYIEKQFIKEDWEVLLNTEGSFYAGFMCVKETGRENLQKVSYAYIVMTALLLFCYRLS